MLVKSLQKEKVSGAREGRSRFLRIPYRYAQPMEDWWDTISEYERQGILQGLAESDAGLGKPHSEVMKKYEKWL